VNFSCARIGDQSISSWLIDRLTDEPGPLDSRGWLSLRERFCNMRDRPFGCASLMSRRRRDVGALQLGQSWARNPSSRRAPEVAIREWQHMRGPLTSWLPGNSSVSEIEELHLSLVAGGSGCGGGNRSPQKSPPCRKKNATRMGHPLNDGCLCDGFCFRGRCLGFGGGLREESCQGAVDFVGVRPGDVVGAVFDDHQFGAVDQIGGATSRG
jgi:hypothetical protein